MLKVERCMQFRLMLSPIISEHPTSTVKDRTLFRSTPGGVRSGGKPASWCCSKGAARAILPTKRR